METIVNRALQRIVADAGKRQRDCKTACKDSLERLQSLEQIHKNEAAAAAAAAAESAEGGRGAEDEQQTMEGEGQPPSSRDAMYANPYVKGLMLAVASGQPKLMVTALDAFAKLVAHGYIEAVEVESPRNGTRRGRVEQERPDDGRATPRTFIDELVELICSCELEDDKVQLRIIQVLLTFVTANSVPVHEGSLLLAVKTIFTVHLCSHNPVNKMTANASLQQMLSAVFMRMELEDKELRAQRKGPEAVTVQRAEAEGEVSAAAAVAGLDVEKDVGKQGGKEENTVSNQTGGKASSSSSSSSPSAPLGANHDELDESSLPPLPPPLLCPETMYPEVWAHLKMAQAYGPRPCPQRLAIALARRRREALGGLPTVHHKDAFLLFRALCVLSVQAENTPDDLGAQGGSAAVVEARQLESKLLSLELLLGILERAGPAFCSTEKFVWAVTNLLCSSVLKNCTKSNTDVVGLSLRLFVMLSRLFKDHLKNEVEVFMTNVFLRMLESENSSQEHKSLVLDVVLAICDSPDMLVEIFLNYDCDFEAIDLYQRIVDALSKVSKGKGVHTDMGYEAEQSDLSLREKGLRGMTAILDTMLECVGESVLKAGGAGNGSNGQGEVAAAVAAAAGMGTGAYMPDGTVQGSAAAAAAAAAAAGGGGGGGGKSGGSQSWEGESEAPWSSGPARSGSNGNLNGSGGAVRRKGSLVNAPVVGSEDTDKSPVTMVQEYDRKKKLMSNLEAGFVRFNIAPHKGILYLVEKGLLEYEPAAVAAFLVKHVDKLDKTQIGDYLGKEKDYKEGFAQGVMHAFVDQMDFTGMTFDGAIRHFLSGFRLPGEAQKIDRMMEKFAERYCLQNPSAFPSADTAFILAFSVIMLNTDLHNPSIKEDRRMTKAGFLGNNRGIANGQNLPDEFLLGIYDRIKEAAISLKEDDAQRERIQQGTSASAAPNPLQFYFTGGAHTVNVKKKEAFDKEREDMIKVSEALVRQRKKKATVQGGDDDEPQGGGGSDSGGAGGAHRTTFISHTNMDVSGEIVEVVRAMFEVAWWPMLGAFSQVLEECGHNSDNGTDSLDMDPLGASMVRLCLLGCRFGIRLGAVTAVEGEAATARETFINGLAKFTLLDTVKEMHGKNIECIKALLTIALEDGNYLAESWDSVLRYISQLARLQLFASGLHTDDIFFGGEEPSEGKGRRGSGNGAGGGGGGGMGGGGAGGGGNSGVAKRGLLGLGGARNKPGGGGGGGIFGNRANQFEMTRDLERSNAEVVNSHLDQAAIDRVFSNSVNLSSDAVHAFIVSLCNASFDEINHSCTATFRSRDVLDDMSQPRVFSLQKLVEVADWNMDSRSRLVWSNIWKVLSEHFAEIGTHENPQVAMYAIDSLRQLAVKFMVKEELRDFNFQRLFLRPFESIMAHSKRLEVREFVLRCIDNLVQVRGQNIRSGWKSILSVLAIAARDPVEEISLFAWETVSRLLRENNEEGRLIQEDCLEVIKCLLAFVETGSLDLSLQAAASLEKISDTLVSVTTGQGAASWALAPQAQQVFGGGLIKGVAGVAGTPPPPASAAAAAAAEANKMHLQLWWPLLFGLSECVGDSRWEVRKVCLQALNRVLVRHGGIFSTHTWELLFRGVFAPMMESAATDTSALFVSSFPADEPPATPPNKASWIATTAGPVLELCAELYFTHDELLSPLLPEVLRLFQSAVCQESEALARIGLDELQSFLGRLWERESRVEQQQDKAGSSSGKGTTQAHKEGEGEASSNVWNCVVSCLGVITRYSLPAELLDRCCAPPSSLTPDSFSDDGSSGSTIAFPDGRAHQKIVGNGAGGDDSQQPLPEGGGRQQAVSVGGATELKALMAQLVVSLRMPRLILSIISRYAHLMSDANVMTLVDTMDQSRAAALRFNRCIELRKALARRDFMVPRGGGHSWPLPVCASLQQEPAALLAMLRALSFVAFGADAGKAPAWTGAKREGSGSSPSKEQQQQQQQQQQAVVGGEGGATQRAADATQRLGRLCHFIVMSYVSLEESMKRDQGAAGGKGSGSSSSSTSGSGGGSSGGSGGGSSGPKPDLSLQGALAELELTNMGPVLMQALGALQQMDDAMLRTNSSWVVASLVRLISCSSDEVREAVQRIFQARIVGLMLTPT